MNKTKMLEWIGTRHVGVSSRTMWVALMGVARGVNDYNGGFDVPYDWDDFSRCYDLVTYGEVTKEELQKVVEVFPFYKPIIDRVYGEVMSLKGYVNLGGGCYSKQL